MRELVNKLRVNYSQDEIESSVIRFFIDKNDINISTIQNKFLNSYIKEENKEIQIELEDYKRQWEICDLINIFECLVSDEDKKENGVVFTPKYIVKYILKNTINEFNINDKIIDPSCGCGAFLCVLAQYLKDRFNVKIIDLIENNIYGLDIANDHIRRTKLILSVIALINNEDKEEIKFNIIETDSLRNNWLEIFNIEGFKYIIGNPPYVNTHDISKENAKYLKQNFKTTQSGTFNIFYAFIEQSMKYLNEDGRLGFIIPNNFITIDSAKGLREYFMDHKYIDQMINFNLNLVFNPIKTYNAIIFLNKAEKNTMQYAELRYNQNIQEELLNANFEPIEYNNLDKEIWHLISTEDKENITKIENIGNKLDKHIRTGIATLKDAVYKFKPVKEDDIYYYMEYKDSESTSYKIEKNITKKIIKISSVNSEEDIINCGDRIIFPYELNEGAQKYTIISEDDMVAKYPECYKYLLTQRELLSTRSQSKSQPKDFKWYEYGRSQGLNNYGVKLIHPTFSSKPKFMIDRTEENLFVNGYAIFTDGAWDVDILQKIINSEVMDFYIRKTSYSIEGGFLCYQKKYFKNFSIPELNDEQIEYLRFEQDTDRLNEYIINIYGLNI